MINWALKYRNLGLSIIPLRPKAKEPLIPWTEFQSRKASEAEVTEWFTRWPDANVGIVTGRVSGLVVIDLDGPEGLKSASNMSLNSTIVSFTGKGKHLWFLSPSEDVVQNAVRKFPGVDVRGDGGYVLAPPSIHPNGQRYRWQNPFNRNLLKDFPQNIVVVTQMQHIPNAVVKEESWIAKSLEGMKNGNIDDTLTSICGRFRHDGLTERDALSLLAPHAARVGASPGHLEEKIRNVWDRYEPSNRVSTQTLYGDTLSHNEGGLVIHSPTNPDSIKLFEQSRIVETGGSESLRTGYPKLDQMLKGGLKSSRLFTLAARTGVGKTNWLIGCSKHLCESGKKVLLFSTEMPYAQIWERYIQTLSNPNSFREHKFYVCDSFAPNLERVEEAINEIKPDVFMFDHINHVSEEQHELGAFMQGLNYLRRKYDVAGIVTAQLNRSADWVDLKTGEKVTPRMSMIKGSGTIEQASSRVLLLSETRVTPEYTEIVGNLDKNDNGDKGLIHFGLFKNPYQMREL